ncbi:hypothetical protein HYZ41_03210 [archaeon]|nr:hypothetical protein [archaeon]
MMPEKILITRPDHDDTTFYLYEWSKEVKNLAEDLGKDVLDLRKERATRKNFESMIMKNNPLLLFLNGHGTCDTLCGYKNETLLDLKNMHLLKSTIVYARSCRTAQILGFQSVKQNISKAFIGYKNDFIFPYDARKTATPRRDTLCEPILSSSNLVMMSLIRGKSPREAFNISQQSYDFFIRKWINSIEIEAPHVLKFLIWNKVNQVCIEN